MDDPYSSLPSLSSGKDRKRGKIEHITYFEAELHFIDKRGNILYFHTSSLYFLYHCGFYLYKMYIDKKIT